jgi:thiol-disulfide isomerase/thioredoxin
MSMTPQTARRTAVLAALTIATSGILFGQSAPKPTAPPGAPAGLAQVPPVEYGVAFPAAKFENLNSAPGQPATIDLTTYLGKKPIVFVYWMAGNARSEKILLDTQAAVDKAGSEKVAFFPIASPIYGSSDVGPIKTRTAALKVKTPVLRDEGFRLLQQLAVRGVPNIAIVDAEGKLRLSNGGSLTQSLEYKLDVEGAIRRVATTGRLGTYGALPTYYPVTELVGKKCPDFDAPLIDDAAAHSFSSMLASDKLNVLIFWSVDCPHCKASLPKLNDWLKGHTAGMNVISAARITDDATKARTAEYCKISGFLFPTFVDKDMQIGATYQVISTPTVLVIRPDGVVDSVLLSSETDLGAALDAKRREILKPPASKG